MLNSSKLSEEERALIGWCRSIRDWPLPSLAWGNLRGVLYVAAIVVFVIVIAVSVGIIPMSSDQAFSLVGQWVVLPGCLWLALGWLTTRFQRMAALIDKLDR